MKIAISTQWNDDFKEIAAITLPVMQEYCARHGYTLFSNHSKEDSPKIIWQRAEDAENLLSKYCDAVVHMDADCLITNLNNRIEDIIELAGDADLIVTSDTDTSIMNDGVCIWLGEGGLFACGDLAFGGKYSEYSSPQDALNERAVPIKIVHLLPSVMNSVLNGEYGSFDPETEWSEGDFILHLPGIGNARRVELLKEYSTKIVR